MSAEGGPPRIDRSKIGTLRPRSGALIAQRLELAQLVLTGDAITLADQVGLGPGGVGSFSASTTNTLVHRAADVLPLVRLAFVDRRGLVTAVPLAAGVYQDPALSPDGRQVALPCETA